MILAPFTNVKSSVCVAAGIVISDGKDMVDVTTKSVMDVSPKLLETVPDMVN